MSTERITWQVVAIVAIAVTGAVAVIQVGDAQAAVLLPMMIGLLTPILQLMGVQKQLNGGLDTRMEEAVRRVMAEGSEQAAGQSAPAEKQKP